MTMPVRMILFASAATVLGIAIATFMGIALGVFLLKHL